ncbi:hypothetical protein PINS_up009242 [Pythium insidiosum]|nr:hypothetical protein PINS_up009242 [Pythium insidiosum]
MDQHRELDTLAEVCDHWAEVVDEVVARAELSRCSLTSCLPTRALVLDARRQLTLQRAHLKTLCITLKLGFSAPPGVHQAASTLTQAKCQSIGWEALLSLVPRLECLRVEETELADLCTPEIVAAAAAQCPSLQKLVLPTPFYQCGIGSWHRQEPREDLLATEIPRTLNTTIQSLEAWQTRSPHGAIGMRELTLPLYGAHGPLPAPLLKALLEAIIRLCPGIEVITDHDGLAKSSQQQWNIDALLWDKFCATLSHLRRFDWLDVPFTTQFFSIFGQYPKPHLTELSLGANFNWDWTAYHEAVGAQQRSENEEQGFGPTARNAAAVLSACPALKKLTIHIQSLGVDYRDFMDQEIFGDDFCEALAMHCPLLEILHIGDTRLQKPGNTTPIMAFTDRALDALRSLPYLLSVRTKATNFTGQGLFSLLEYGQYGTTIDRAIDLYVGDTTGPTKMAFYDVLESFLTCLTQPSQKLTFLDRRIALRIRNGNDETVERAWSKSYLTRIKALVEKFEHRRRGARLHISTQGTDSQLTRFDVLNSFCLETKTLQTDDTRYHVDGKVFVDRHNANTSRRILPRMNRKGEWY